MIRYLQPSEVNLLCEGAEMFFAEGSLPGGFNRDVFTRKWAGLIEDGIGVVIASFGENNQLHGALGAVGYEDMNNGDKTAVENFWFMLPQFRGRGIVLLKEFEKWARAIGAKRVAMIHLMNLQPEQLKSLYERMGYKAAEVNYIKELEAKCQ